MAPPRKRSGSEPERGLGAGLFSGGAVAMLVVCCAGHALVLGVLGGVALGSVLGVGAGALAAALLGVGIVMLRRRRKDASCAVPGVARSSR